MAGDVGRYTRIGRGGKKIKYQTDDWACKPCDEVNFKKNDKCHFCSKQRHTNAITYGQTKEGKLDLADRATKDGGGGDGGKGNGKGGGKGGGRGG